MAADSTQQKSEVLYPPARPDFAHAKSVFLAGSTAGPDWRATVKAALAHLPLTVLDPFRSDWDGSWREEASFAPFREQVEWELDMQERADVVVVYFHPDTQAPVSLLELGLCARRLDRAVVVCPDGYWKRGNVHVVCSRFGIPLVDDVDQLISAVKEKLWLV